MLITNVFLLQSCATISRGSSQKIPVTSNPIGARVIVDGNETGYAPLNLKLKRKENHIIRVEKQGYNPLEIRITRKTSAISIGGSIFINFVWGCAGAVLGAFGGWLIGEIRGYESLAGIPPPEVYVGFIAGAILGWAGGVYVDSKSGANDALLPEELNVVLTKVGQKSQSNIIQIDAERFQNIKWIRIKLVDSESILLSYFCNCSLYR